MGLKVWKCCSILPLCPLEGKWEAPMASQTAAGGHLCCHGGAAADSEALKASKVPCKWSDNDLNLIDYFL